MAVNITSTKQADKLNSIILDYRVGQGTRAASRIRKLTKRELVNILLANHQLENGFLGDGPGNYEFQSFVDRALDNYGE